MTGVTRSPSQTECLYLILGISQVHPAKAMQDHPQLGNQKPKVKLPNALIDRWKGVLSAMAFHEKAGRSQDESVLVS